MVEGAAREWAHVATPVLGALCLVIDGAEMDGSAHRAVRPSQCNFPPTGHVVVWVKIPGPWHVAGQHA